MDVRNINILVLAYLGDTIYENYVRKHLIYKGFSNVNALQKEAIKYVSAKAQMKYVLKLIDSNLLTEEELSIYKRGRNNTSKSCPKNCDIITYKCATGLEAIIGYLDFVSKNDRIDFIMRNILEVL